jgi:hypothetical protein
MMSGMVAPLLGLLLGAELTLQAGAPLAPALARLAPGDTLRLGPGVHQGSLGRLSGVQVAGAGPGVTVVVAPEGVDGVESREGTLELSGLTRVVGARRSALKVLGGQVRLERVALVGGSCGAFVDEGEATGLEVLLSGDYGLLLARGTVRLRDLTATGRVAGVASLHGDLEIARAVVTGPSREGGISVAGGRSRLSEIAIRGTGPTGLTLTGGEVVASDLAVAGPIEVDHALGDCVQVRHGTLTLRSSLLLQCGGAALEASGARIVLSGVDAAGGEAGGLILIDRTTATLDGNRLTRTGPGLVVSEGSSARGFGNRFLTDPALWVDCADGASALLDGDPDVRRPCASAQGGGSKAHDPAGPSLDKPPTP